MYSKTGAIHLINILEQQSQTVSVKSAVFSENEWLSRASESRAGCSADCRPAGLVWFGCRSRCGTGDSDVPRRIRAESRSFSGIQFAVPTEVSAERTCSQWKSVDDSLAAGERVRRRAPVFSWLLLYEQCEQCGWTLWSSHSGAPVEFAERVPRDSRLRHFHSALLSRTERTEPARRPQWLCWRLCSCRPCTHSNATDSRATRSLSPETRADTRHFWTVWTAPHGHRESRPSVGRCAHSSSPSRKQYSSCSLRRFEFSANSYYPEKPALSHSLQSTLQQLFQIDTFSNYPEFHPFGLWALIKDSRIVEFISKRVSCRLLSACRSSLLSAVWLFCPFRISFSPSALPFLDSLLFVIRFHCCSFGPLDLNSAFHPRFHTSLKNLIFL